VESNKLVEVYAVILQEQKIAWMSIGAMKQSGVRAHAGARRL